jgi:hypothetical protein
MWEEDRRGEERREKRGRLLPDAALSVKWSRLVK